MTYLAQEKISGGDLIDHVISDSFSEPICRYYFKQLLLGIHHMHIMGFSHRDLKPENILLDHQYNLKIIDLGFACPLEGHDSSGYIYSNIGTPGYKAPEIMHDKPYTGQDVDLFACGVILFMLCTNLQPFKLARRDDPRYELIRKNRSDLFWE